MTKHALKLKHTFCVAPMLDCTDRHFRYFVRLISHHAVLYTEMITTGALIHGDRERFLAYSDLEHPVAVQLGGSDPKALKTCAQMIADYGYDEVNLNVGCPSDRVQSGRFGACLMKSPELVADCIASMVDAVDIPVTLKTRIGLDDNEAYEPLHTLISKVADAGCNTMIIHARNAWLNGISPKQNREIPPLRYDVVYRLKQDFPKLEVVLNGGLKSLNDIQTVLAHVDGVMVGREAYSNPYSLANIDQQLYQDPHDIPGRIEVLERFLPYVAQELEQGCQLKHITRHILGLFQGLPGAKHWRRHISENVFKPNTGIELLNSAVSALKNYS
ncbi:MAG TPA: tRNA dihydrouridine(20/20a) synthase DusA [Pseudomonadales bacterium]